MDRIILLHICCAPCATEVIENLRRKEYKVVGLFYNLNIYPEEEYALRLDNLHKLASCVDLPFSEGAYNTRDWYKEIQGSKVQRFKGSKVQGLEAEPEGGERCKICYRMRLDYTARIAKSKGYKVFATTLTVSPYKLSKIINPIGEEVGERHKIKFLAEDFKKQDGFKRSVILSKKYGLYRQSYCGCEFSLRNEGLRV
ncbi:epoxyqueuosine reductase QueH [candidate division WOR-3 bacterium]|nr:epoxyqueuosine reductase QueH [candidate division WOR-3 bacterium]